MLFGSRSASLAMDDIEDEDALDFIFGQGHFTLDVGGALTVLKPEPLEIGESD
jgi:hypothetical protein